MFIPRFPVKSTLKAGFTLVELSIVLVIIGLIIGGVLVGRDLINAATIRAQISQIEKYNSAVNTFRGKYGYLPGDIPNPYATQYGFLQRGTNPGEGDGNGVIEANLDDYAGANGGNFQLCGETGMFWVDLSTAGLIEGRINPSAYAGNAWWSCDAMPVVSAAGIAAYLPAAKLGNGNSVYVWSGGWQYNDEINYFGLASVSGGDDGEGIMNMGITVQQAYNIDAKIDDGLPQSGRVTAIFDDGHFYWASGNAGMLNYPGGNGGLVNWWAYPAPVNNPATAVGETGDSATCYDVGKGNKLPVTYSTGGNNSPNNSQQVNCALSFRFQ